MSIHHLFIVQAIIQYRFMLTQPPTQRSIDRKAGKHPGWPANHIAMLLKWFAALKYFSLFKDFITAYLSEFISGPFSVY